MNINGIKTIMASYDSVVNQIVVSIKESSKHIFIHLNMQNFYVLKNNMELLNKHENKCKVFLEGIGMKLASLLINKRWCPDTNGTDLFPYVFDFLSLNRNKVYFLGATSNVINQAAKIIKKCYNGIEIVGFNNGYFNKENYNAVSENISKLSPDLLIIGMGMEKEAEFLSANYDRLSVGAIWCVGGLFDFISGNRKRAPKIIRKIRFEWLYRFLIEPKAKFRRIFVTPLWFFKCVIIERFLKKTIKLHIY